jgi:hypothetical protein
MKHQKETLSMTPSVRRWRRWLLSLTILLLLLSLLLVSAPYLVGKSIQGLSRNGGYGNATIGKVEFNPLIGTLVLRDFAIEKQGVTNLTVDEVRIWLHWMPLLQKRLIVRELSVRGLKTSVSRSPEGSLTVAGISVDSGADTTGGLEWGVGLEAVSLSGVSIEYSEAGQRLDLEIGGAAIERLQSWTPDSPISLVSEGRINGASFSLEGSALPLARPLEADIRVKTALLDLSVLAGFMLQDGMGIQGQARINSRIKLSHEPKQTGITSQGVLVVKGFGLEQKEAAGTQLSLDAESDGTLTLQQREDGIQFKQQGRLGIAGLRFATDEAKFEAESGGWKGGIEVRLPAGQKVAVKADGELRVEGVSALEAGRNGELRFGVLEMRKGRLDLLDGGESISHESDMDVRDLMLTGPQFDLRERQLSWRGQLRISPSRSEAVERNLVLEGSINSDALSLGMEQRPLDLELHDLGFQGQLKLGQEEMLGGELNSGALSLSNRDSGRIIAGWDSLQATQLKSDDMTWFESSGVVVNRLVMGPQEVVQPDTEVVRVDRLVLESPGFSKARGVSIRRVLSDSMKVVLRRDNNGGWNFNQVAGLVDADDSGPAASQDTDADFSIVIDRVEVAGTSRLLFEDRAVEPAYLLDAEISQLEISGLDSTAQEQLSPLKLVLKPSQHSRLEAEGGVQLFAKQPSADLRFILSALELPPLSSYTGKLLGYNLDSGQMDAKAGLKVDSGKLDGLVELELHQLEVSPLDEEARKRLDSEMSVPLDTGLSMLRDKQNSIRLKMPISGDSSNPDFDFSDAINQAMGKAVKKGAFTYLAAALQPFGTLLAIAQVAGDAANAIRLDPLVFVPGSNETEKSPRAYLEKVAEVMSQRPEIRIRLCGIAVEQDRAALASRTEGKKGDKDGKKPSGEVVADDKLLQLAARRADGVKTSLAEKGIEPGRLINCAPVIDQDAKGEPRVDLLI